MSDRVRVYQPHVRVPSGVKFAKKEDLGKERNVNLHRIVLDAEALSDASFVNDTGEEAIDFFTDTGIVLKANSIVNFFAIASEPIVPEDEGEPSVNIYILHRPVGGGTVVKFSGMQFNNPTGALYDPSEKENILVFEDRELGFAVGLSGAVPGIASGEGLFIAEVRSAE